MTKTSPVIEHLRRWAEELVDLTRRNRLLYFKHTRSTSFEFAQASEEILGRVGRGGWRFYLPEPPPEDPEALYDPKPPVVDELVVAMTPARHGPQILRGLSGLARRSQAEFLDSGLWVLYLGLGQLRWTDVDGQEVASPLALVPVELKRDDSGRSWTLMLSEDGEPAINPALAVKLESDFNIVLPGIDEFDELDIAEITSRVGQRVKKLGWTTESTAVLTNFTFQKEVIYRDIRDNEASIAAHDLVRLLAEGPTSDLAVDLNFSPEPDDSLDERHPPEELLCVLDADSSQRKCIIAARAGHSFVMDGPPGTGKSQTIANIIAHLMADGKTVLFVSEKAAALDVVQRRLADLQLDPFVLSLHSRTATRKAVAQELGRSLLERPRATSRIGPTEVADLRKAREKLSKYAIAINEERLPLHRSLHNAIGRVSQLQDLPQVAVPAVDVSAMTPDAFGQVLGAAQQLGRAWEVISREDFMWKRLTTASSGQAREAELRELALSSRRAASALSATVINILDELRLTDPVGPEGVADLIKLMHLIDQRPPAVAALLSSERGEGAGYALIELADLLDRTASIEAELDGQRPNWRSVDPDISSVADQLRGSLRENSPAVDVTGASRATDLELFATSCDELKRLADALINPCNIVRECFGVEAAPSIDQAARLADLAALATVPTRPERSWLSSLTRPAVDEARQVLIELLNEFRAQGEALAPTFQDQVLELDLKTLKARFDSVHKGFRKLGGQYRADKKLLASATVSGKTDAATLDQLGAAVEWQQLAERLTVAEGKHAPLLGPRYYASRAAVDLGEIERAFRVADQALERAAGQIDAEHLANQIAIDGSPDERLPIAGRELIDLGRQVEDLLLGARFHGLAISIRSESLDFLVEWAERTSNSLRGLAGRLDESVGADGTLDDLSSLGERIEEFCVTTVRADELREANVEFIPPGTRESPLDLVAAAGWSALVRRHFGGIVRTRTASALINTTLGSHEVAELWHRFETSASALFAEFESTYATDLSAEARGSFAGADELFDALAQSVADIGIWESFSEAKEFLQTAGWAPLIDACEESKIDGEHVPHIVERSVLQRWIDQTIDRDRAISPKRARDRDALAQGFRDHDAALVRAAAAQVINRCSARRPDTLVGQAGIINQQAQLKRRHKPVRLLMSEAGAVAQRLKPCFMMSPLSVSQFLPTELTFDVVIFDEASQVREADAICCLYRADQLIVAGDPKQLPPTSFFDRMSDFDDEDLDDEILDFESVLDRCKAQGFRQLPLNWHYRSQHESLITFSNRSFYESRLATFPSAAFEHPSLGVELFLVDGVYDRGGTRANKVEASQVVDRVIYHRRTHPEMSIGVVALSVAQQIAIEADIEMRATSEPELAALVSNDRLSGFFVKNLENVQGDERDLIVLSIGYGPDEVGKFTMNFGPMNRPGGERRLNVAITRARRRVEVIASFAPNQINSENPTIQHLKRYMQYADRGIEALVQETSETGLDAESPFEEEVLRSARSLGYEAVPQVGVAGYRIDVGIRHPTRDGSFLIGIECDGATYHSSKVARDRDRLRQQVLEGLGWTIHRIWSTAWFSDRDGEVERLRRVLDGAIDQGDEPKFLGRTIGNEVDVAIHQVDPSTRPKWTEPLRAVTAPTAGINGDFLAPSSRPTIARHIVEVVERHGPIHVDDCLTAIRESWGMKRAGSRIQEAFDAALASLRTRSEIEQAGSFLKTPRSAIAVRVPTSEHMKQREVRLVDPRELELAVECLLLDAGETAFGDLRVAWARLFGWKRVGVDIELAFERSIDSLVDAGRVRGTDVLVALEAWKEAHNK